ncbi:MAG TPA: serine/threonine-protein kinase [Pyrinomonadaceae bacterium]|jgi:serine/threonine protein kinase
MKAESWSTIKKILEEVLSLAPPMRAAFLERADLSAEIKSEVKSLLKFEAESEQFMSVSASNLTGELIFEEESRTSALIGQRIGIYEIREELGLGGMGAVYLAARIDGKFEQKVALKLLKREFNVEKLRRNFRRESEIQSKLNHPNIARLLDTGTTGDHLPYLVMEYVDGLPVDRFCESRDLPLPARLKLFNKVCAAVAHAHRNLIIHRDLKPSNILVTEKGEPKLLDFGISKLLGAAELQDKTAVTALGAMTPEYASPEQLRGESVSTATDIYSLGVVLYKILTGAHPFDLKGKTNGELIKTLTEDDPPAPSAITNYRLRITNQSNRKAQIANQKFLRGDLDKIILKSLRKEPGRRYETVEQFCADLWRFMDGLPVSARKATAFYRAGKFFRRNKIAVAAAGLILLSLVAGVAVASWQAREAKAQAQVAQNETERAKTEQEKAEKISRFMAKIISYANPAWYAEGAKFGGNARVIDVIEDLSDKIDTEFSGEPDVAAELHHKFSEAAGWASRNKTGERREKLRQRSDFHSLRALELRKQFYGEWHELVAKDLFYAYTIIGKNDREKAELLMRAIVMMRDTNPNNLNFPYMLEAYTAYLILPGKYENHEVYRNAVSPPTNENKYQIAERYLRESLPVFRLHYKPDNSAVYSAECKLAYALAMQDKWTDFDEHFNLCNEGKEKNEGKSNGLSYFYEMVEKVLIEKKNSK